MNGIVRGSGYERARGDEGSELVLAGDSYVTPAEAAEYAGDEREALIALGSDEEPAIDHSACIVSTRYDTDAHTHEGHAGFWRFDDERHSG